ncbi:MAG: flagellar brake protein [Acidimicrobiia bacterium]
MAQMPTLTAGQTVLLEAAIEDDPTRHALRIEAIQDNEIVLAQISRGSVPRALIGETYRLIVLARNTMYNVDCVVTRSSSRSIRLQLSPDAERISRRQYVRVVVDVPMSCLLLNDATNQWSQFPARMTDISAGGLAMAASTIAPARSTILFSIAIPGERPVVAVGRVLPTDAEIRNVVQLSVRGPALRAEFTMVRESERDRLMRFIFSEMLRQRRAELDAADLSEQPVLYQSPQEDD